MKPIMFREANTCLTKPESMTDEECSSLPAYTDGEECISCWKMSFMDRIRALIYGRVWLSVLSGHTQPPVALICEKTVFRRVKVPFIVKEED